jgi:hypothetical protein
MPAFGLRHVAQSLHSLPPLCVNYCMAGEVSRAVQARGRQRSKLLPPFPPQPLSSVRRTYFPVAASRRPPAAWSPCGWTSSRRLSPDSLPLERFAAAAGFIYIHHAPLLLSLSLSVKLGSCLDPSKFQLFTLSPSHQF